jgi:hypothetical protein
MRNWGHTKGFDDNTTVRLAAQLPITQFSWKKDDAPAEYSAHFHRDAQLANESS